MINNERCPDYDVPIQIYRPTTENKIGPWSSLELKEIPRGKK